MGVFKIHDCGEHGPLTVLQIAERAGITRSAIQMRLAAGVTGADLVRTKHVGQGAGGRKPGATNRPRAPEPEPSRRVIGLAYSPLFGIRLA